MPDEPRDIKPKPSELPVEQMAADARRLIQQDEGGWDVSGSADVGYHVLALVEENERLRTELAKSKLLNRGEPSGIDWDMDEQA